jgi:hypothetical protein
LYVLAASVSSTIGLSVGAAGVVVVLVLVVVFVVVVVEPPVFDAFGVGASAGIFGGLVDTGGSPCVVEPSAPDVPGVGVLGSGVAGSGALVVGAGVVGAGTVATAT